jgi:hypothetical protein
VNTPRGGLPPQPGSRDASERHGPAGCFDHPALKDSFHRMSVQNVTHFMRQDKGDLIRICVAQFEQGPGDKDETTWQSEGVDLGSADGTKAEAPLPIANAVRQPVPDGLKPRADGGIGLGLELLHHSPGHVAADLELGPDGVVLTTGHRLEDPLAFA